MSFMRKNAGPFAVSVSAPVSGGMGTGGMSGGPGRVFRVGRVLAVATAGAWALFASAGCSRGGSAAERQMAELREEVTRVEADRDKFEQRVNALEIAASERPRTAPEPSITPQPTSRPGATPKLKVVHLSPGAPGSPVSNGPHGEDAPGIGPAPAPPSNEDPEDNSPRPTIRVTGSPSQAGAGSSRNARRGVREQVEQTMPDEGAAPSPAKPSAIDPEAKKSYDVALSQVNSRKYAEALESFAAFLVKWPDHPLADNAMYWRGECYFAQGEYSRAAEQFEGLVARFPVGNKAPDALLKLGICQQKLSNPQKGKFYFEKLSREFPKSDAARRIPAEGR
jgi:tol-pal system protein YbgF